MQGIIADLLAFFQLQFPHPSGMTVLFAFFFVVFFLFGTRLSWTRNLDKAFGFKFGAVVLILVHSFLVLLLFFVSRSFSNDFLVTFSASERCSQVVGHSETLVVPFTLQKSSDFHPNKIGLSGISCSQFREHVQREYFWDEKAVSISLLTLYCMLSFCCGTFVQSTLGWLSSKLQGEQNGPHSSAN